MSRKAGGKPIEFNESSAADGDLASERIREGQPAVEIAVKRHAVFTVERDEPRLGVVRIRRENGVRQRETARIAFAGAGIAPGRGRVWKVFAAAARERRRCGKHLQDMAAPCHSRSNSLTLV